MPRIPEKLRLRTLFVWPIYSPGALPGAIACSKLYYAAPTAIGNYVLWVTDGTLSGTHNIFGGTQNFGTQTPYGFAPTGDDEVFVAEDPTGHIAVWVTQGTGSSTIELVSGLQGQYSLSPQQFVTVGSKVVFEGRDSIGDEALWSTGANGGVQILLQFDKPRDRVTTFGNFAIAADSDAGGSAQLWVTDGTAADTALVYSGATSSDFDDDFYLAYVSGDALFEATDATGGRGLFAVYGAGGGNQELLSSKQGLYALQPSALTLSGTKAFFSAYDSHGRQALWITNGTAAGTNELYYNASGPALAPTDVTSDGSVVAFEGRDSSGAYSLFWSDGTAGGTHEVAAGLFNQNIASPNFLAYGARVLFVAADSSGDLGLWTSDGASADTAEIEAGAQGAYSLTPAHMLVVGFRVFFLATDATGKVGVWTTNGTAAGTDELLSGKQGAYTLVPQNLYTFGARLAFVGLDSSGPLRRLGDGRHKRGNQRSLVPAGRRCRACAVFSRDFGDRPHRRRLHRRRRVGGMVD